MQTGSRGRRQIRNFSMEGIPVSCLPRDTISLRWSNTIIHWTMALYRVLHVPYTNYFEKLSFLWLRTIYIMALRYPNKQELKKDNGLVKFAYKVFSLCVYIVKIKRRKERKEIHDGKKSLILTNSIYSIQNEICLSFLWSYRERFIINFLYFNIIENLNGFIKQSKSIKSIIVLNLLSTSFEKILRNSFDNKEFNKILGIIDILEKFIGKNSSLGLFFTLIIFDIIGWKDF